MNLDRVTAQFDGLASEYGRGQAERLDREKAIARLRPTATDFALDVATGTGAVGLALAAHAGVVVGVDASQGMIDVARTAIDESHAPVVFIRCPAERLPLVDATFDLVTCSRALHHMPHPRRAIREMARVARPDARLLIIDSVTYEDPDLASTHNELELLRDPSHARALPLSELRATIEAAGFAIEEVEIEESWRAVATWLHDSGAEGELARRVEGWIRDSRLRDPEFHTQHFGDDANGEPAFRYSLAWIRARKTGDGG